ncbi:FHA domain-containing protein [Euryarchaeota archaeon]|nr:FHA domain-containing protein [Euryarchaeota archaeon]
MEPVVVVDGSNVIHANAGSRRFFSVARVKNVIGKLSKLGYTYKIGMKGKTYNYIMYHAEEDEINEDDKSALEKLVNDLEVSLLDAEQDDRWIHLAAIEFDGYILSHDQFRNEIEQWEEEGRHDIVEEIKKRRVELQFFEDTPIFDLPPVVGEESDVPSPPDPEKDIKPMESKSSSDESGEDLDTWDEPISKETVKEPFVEPEVPVEDTPEETHVPMLLRLQGGAWTEVQVPLDTPLGRVFFAEIVELTPATSSILEKISRKHFMMTDARNDPERTTKEGYILHDLGSTNGTQFRGAKLGPRGVHVPPIVPRSELVDKEWPSILLGSRLVELRVGATLEDTDHPSFD